MTLDSHPNYPCTLSYVVKLHRDAALRSDALRGRLEHIASGRVYHFERSEELLAFLVMDMESAQPATQTAGAI